MEDNDSVKLYLDRDETGDKFSKYVFQTVLNTRRKAVCINNINISIMVGEFWEIYPRRARFQAFAKAGSFLK